MNSYLESAKQFATGGLMGGSILNSITKKKDNFKDNEEISNTTITIVIIVLLVLFIAYIFMCIAVYKLTNSSLQLILFILFGLVYLWFALIYYAFSGYRFVKVK
jgi:Na+/glutamate symporter